MSSSASIRRRKRRPPRPVVLGHSPYPGIPYPPPVIVLGTNNFFLMVKRCVDLGGGYRMKRGAILPFLTISGARLPIEKCLRLRRLSMPMTLLRSCAKSSCIWQRSASHGSTPSTSANGGPAHVKFCEHPAP